MENIYNKPTIESNQNHDEFDKSKMKALILAGGSGTRLRPLTHSLPKQLIPIANKPIILYAIEHLKQAGINDIGIILSPETGNQIIRVLNENCTNVSLTYVYQEKPLGLAHAVKTAENYLGDSSFIMYLGDNMIGGGVTNMIEEFNSSKSDAAILLKEIEDPRKFGVAELDQCGNIKSLIEKPKCPSSNLALVGVYVFNKTIHKAIENIHPSNRGELEITDAIQELVDSNYKINTNILRDWWIDTGKKDDLLKANTIILNQQSNSCINGEIDSLSKVIGAVSIEKDTSIINSTIKGPVVIGANSKIINSIIYPYTSIGANCIIENSTLAESVILSKSKISHIAKLRESIIGHRSIVAKSNNSEGHTNLIIGDDTEVLL
tara:strand:+ start:945 stop:2078 length:1134 start_codon:yes stop_codon:yes gene_type:complete